ERTRELDHAPRGLRPPRSGGEDHRLRVTRGERLRGLRVGPNHLGPTSQALHELNEVVDERVVVVDDKDHVTAPIRSAAVGAPPKAASIADAFASVSSSSRSGSESATIPAPVCTCAVPSAMTTVLSVMQKSMSPVNVR